MFWFFMKIYVIGGHGFIGSHLIPELQAHNHDVEVIDPRGNCSGGYTHVQSDVMTLPLNRFKKGLYVHLASNSQHTPTINESKKDLDTFLHVIGAAALTESPLLVASTSAVSGGSTPIALYGRSAEIYSMPFKPHCKVGFMRIYSVYGPGQHDNFIKRALDSAVRGQPLTVVNPHFIRDWIHVHDVVDAIMHQIITYIDTGRIMPVSHIGTGAGLPINMAVSIIKAVIGVDIPVTYSMDNSRREPVVSVAQKIPYGWQAKIPFDVGIRKVVFQSVTSA